MSLYAMAYWLEEARVAQVAEWARATRAAADKWASDLWVKLGGDPRDEPRCEIFGGSGGLTPRVTIYRYPCSVVTRR